MAKDPAFTFYSQDFLTGTMFFTDEQVGKYVRLLIAQHQLGGLIPEADFNKVVAEDSKLRSKFIETEDGFYNERLMKEMIKRQKKSSNLSDNAKKRWDAKAMQLHNKSNTIAYNLHMPIENENESIIINKELFEKICQNILDQKEFWLGIFKIFSVKEEQAKELFRQFTAEQANAGNYLPAIELKKYFQNWLKKNIKLINNENGQKKLSYKIKF